MESLADYNCHVVSFEIIILSYFKICIQATRTENHTQTTRLGMYTAKYIIFGTVLVVNCYKHCYMQ